MYKHSYERIAGFGRPDWDMENNITSEDKPVTLYPSADYELGDRTLRKGDKGSDVKAMQAMLISLGYDLGSTGADGNFGSKTEKAVKAYQTESCLNADGVYGQKTHAALMASVVPKPNPDEPVPMPPTTDTTKWLTITGYSVNARVGDSEQYDSVGHLNKGDAIEYVATASNGWNAGRWKERIVWVSPDYSTITTS